MQLYDLDLSGNCYKVRLFAALAGIPLTVVPVDFLAGEHQRPPLIGLNPFGQLPILVDGGRVLRDSLAILVYLARKCGREDWLPSEPWAMAEVLQWLSTSVNEIQHGPGAARLIVKFGAPLDAAVAQRIAARILGLLDRHLAGHDWLALDRPSLAECAVYPYVALAPEGDVSLQPYAHVRRWIAQVQGLPGYVPMPGL